MMPRKELGFTLIEAMFSVALFVVIVLGVYEAYRALYLSASASEHKLSALELAMSRLELAKSFSYEEVDIFPDGELEPELSVEKDGFAFEVETRIEEEAGYKLMKVSVGCATCRNFEGISLTGRFAP